MLNINNGTKTIIRRLLTRRYIGGKHTEENHIFQWMSHLPSKEGSGVLDEWKMLINEGFILRSKKTGEYHISLNPRKLKELYELIK